jgi:hypothetical protein
MFTAYEQKARKMGEFKILASFIAVLKAHLWYFGITAIKLATGYSIFKLSG